MELKTYNDPALINRWLHNQGVPTFEGLAA
jgi:hypothetical protein